MMPRTYAAWFGSGLLVITALFHLTGFPAIPAAPSITDASTFHEAVLKPLWLFAAMHWLLIATVGTLLARSPSGVARIVLLCCGSIVLIDASVLYWFVGPFIGVWFLMMAGLAMMVAALPKNVPKDARSHRV